MKLVLSISGGGVRGIIPAMILTEIEKRTLLPIANSFDLIAGTSTGGIISALLSTPNDKGKPKYSAEQVTEMYKSFGKIVFKQSAFRKAVTLDGLIHTKYSIKPLEKLLKEYFGNIKLSESLTNLLISAYQISGNPYPYFFKTYYARNSKNSLKNPYLWECARATSAANSYFKPYKFDKFHTFLDGGLFANNPSMCVYAEAKKVYGEFEQIVIISIGTGEDLIGYNYNQIKNWGMIQWALPFFKQTSISADETVNYMLKTLTVNADQYFRLQTSLDKDLLSMDNVSEENINKLEQSALITIDENKKTIDQIVNIINLKNRL